MNRAIDRKVISEAIIVLAVCVGLWMMFVQPKVSELAELEQTITEAKNNPILQNHDLIAEMAMHLDDVRERVIEVQTQNAFGEDTSSIYGAVKDLAQVHGVTIKRLAPESSHTTDDGVSSAVISVRIEAKYEQVASFVDALDQIDGFLCPRSMTLHPRGESGNGSVDAQLSYEAVSFAIPDALAMLVREADADD